MPNASNTDLTPASSGLSSKAALWIGILAGGWMATLALVIVFFLSDGTIGVAQAEDPPSIGGVPLPGLGSGNSGNSGSSGSVDPNDATQRPRGITNPGGGTSDSNNRAIALSASIGGGQSAVYYFDTVNQRILVYQYSGGVVNSNRALRSSDRGGLRLLAARHMDFDLRLEGYRDLSERTRNQLKSAFESAMESDGKKGKGGLKPLKVKMK